MKAAKQLVRTILSVFALAALVIGIAFLVKNLSVFNTQELISKSAPLLEKAGLDENEVGQVAGEFVERLSDTKIRPAEEEPVESTFALAITGDIHNSLDNLSTAIAKAKLLGISNIICIGDLTDYGEIDSLQNVRHTLDSSGLAYSCLPGDRDLYEAVGPENYDAVFQASRFYSKILGGKKFVFFDNSANYTLLPQDRLAWLAAEVEDADFVVLSQPVWQPVVSLTTPVMGVVDGEETPEIRQQAEDILKIIRDSNVQAIIAADHHHSSKSVDSEDPTLSHIVVGAVADDSKERVNLQSARFTIMDFFDDGTFEFRDVVL